MPGPLLGERHVRSLLEGALHACKEADQAEVVLSTSDEALTRFANNTIHQNVSERNSSLRVRVVMGKRIGVAIANSLGAQALHEAAKAACTIARFSEENADFQSLPAPAGRVAPVKEAFAETTAATTPEQRAKAVRTIIRRAEASKLTAAGAYSTACEELAVANSLGSFAYQPLTGDGTIIARVASTSNFSSGWATTGVMMSETLAAESAYALAGLEGGGYGLDFQYRTSTLGGSGQSYGPNLGAPYWFKLVRSGNNFTGYTSADGTSWVQKGSTQTIPMTTTVYVGLATTSGVNGQVATVTFDNVTITSP